MAIAEPANCVTDEERRQFEADGFFIRHNVYTDDEIDVLCGRVDKLIEQVERTDSLTPDEKQVILKRNSKSNVQSGPESLNSLFRIHLFSRLIREHIRDPRRLEPISQLVGPDLFCPNDLYFFKPPGTGRPIAWHQDSWYFNNTYESSDVASLEESSIGTWLAVDAADVDNGCLWVIPGSHIAGVVEHTEIGHEEELPVRHRAEVAKTLEDREVPVEVAKGSLVFFNNALLHRSTPNRSERYRRAYVVHYMKATIRNKASGRFRGGPKGMGDWGSVEAHISGRQVEGCVKTTVENESLDWDVALDRELRIEEVSVTHRGRGISAK
jgi:phytanoyl-CoA hydroxylase